MNPSLSSQTRMALRVGRAPMFSLNHTETVLDLLSAAERLLAATGDAVTVCTGYGTTTLPTRPDSP